MFPCNLLNHKTDCYLLIEQINIEIYPFEFLKIVDIILSIFLDC